MTKIFRYTAIAEGVSYLLLFANMLILKPNFFELYKKILFPLGMAHGLLFIAYIFIAIAIKSKQNWSMKDLFFVLIASLIPFGTFIIERKYIKL